MFYTIYERSESVKIKLLIFLTSTKEHGRSEIVMKRFESSFRPIKGDIMEDPGFDPRFHNGYEVVKVTVQYEKNECYVSLHPLAIEMEEISLDDYIAKLVANGWQIVSKDEVLIS